MSFNWIDWVIIGVLVYHAYLGWEAGFFPLLISLVSFMAAVWAAIAWQVPVSQFLTEKFGVAASWSNVLSYIIIAFVVQEIISQALGALILKIPKKILNSKFGNWLGALVSALNGLIITSFFLLVVLVLPLRGTVKRDIVDSRIGGQLAKIVERYGGPVRSVVKEVGETARKFFTIEPGSKETITLDVAPKESDMRIDSQAENKMLALVNAERAKAGVAALTMDAKITEVARAHSRDMFTRRYFSHYSPEGKDASDRMEKGGVTFTIAGENLAYAPGVETAHQGLMESPGHKRNILDPQFKRVGIGIIATDSFGMMATQNFAN